MSCTGFVPKTITGRSDAGSGTEHQEGPEMSYICGGNSATSGNTAQSAVDLHKQGAQGRVATRVDSQRVVPDLYRRPLRQRAVDYAAARAIAAALYPFVLWAYRGERKAGQR